MLEWASNLTLTYKQPEMKGQLDSCLRCLEGTKVCNVNMALAPEVLKEYLKEHYQPFYSESFHFADDTESESAQASDQETEDEAEFDEGSTAGLYYYYYYYYYFLQST